MFYDIRLSEYCFIIFGLITSENSSLRHSPRAAADRLRQKEVFMKNKILTGILSLGLVLSLAACGNAAADSASTETSAAEEASTEQSAESDSAEETAQEGDSADTASAAEIEDGTLTTPYFTMEIPSSWKEGDYSCTVDETDDTYSVSFVYTPAAENNEGGNLCQIIVSTDVPEYIRYVGGDFVCGLKTADEDTSSRYISISYPTDVQFGEDTEEGFMKLYNSAQTFKNRIKVAGDYEKVDMTFADAMADVEYTVNGVILDAAMHSFTILTTEGSIADLGGEDFSTANSEIQIGHCYEVTFKGLLDSEAPDGESGNAVLVSLKNTDDQVPEKDYEAMYTAGQVILAFEAENMEYLSSYCKFPLKLDGKEIASSEEFSKLDFNSTITDELRRSVRYADLYNSEISGDSYTLSFGYDGAPYATISKDADGSWYVTELNNSGE